MRKGGTVIPGWRSEGEGQKTCESVPAAWHGVAWLSAPLSLPSLPHGFCWFSSLYVNASAGLAEVTAIVVLHRRRPRIRIRLVSGGGGRIPEVMERRARGELEKGLVCV